jgi:hypothetical protein
MRIVCGTAGDCPFLPHFPVQQIRILFCDSTTVQVVKKLSESWAAYLSEGSKRLGAPLLFFDGDTIVIQVVPSKTLETFAR